MARHIRVFKKTILCHKCNHAFTISSAGMIGPRECPNCTGINVLVNITEAIPQLSDSRPLFDF